ncbi:MAG: helix-turn-helix transcriptional regulator [Clostridia bacterium]|nr:helix-turn-helix transcriptional regulator [Clostridia bacterium]
MEKYYNDIAAFNSEKIQSVSNIAGMLAKHLLLENMLKPDFDENMQKAVAFINENLCGDLSIRSISKNINVSKSVLYKRFHACFNCTVSEYINTRRVEKSIELLTRTDLSIEEISQKVGFASASYFSKIFKKEKGVSPLNYKKRV